MKIAFSIILNGIHHLKHNDYYKQILDNFDLWVVCEGACHSHGSTSWCHSVPDEYHNNGRSIDGTCEFLEGIKDSKFIYIKGNGLWDSKDIMVNECIDAIKRISNDCVLFEIDIDEQWSKKGINLVYQKMLETNAKYGKIYCNHFVGPSLIAHGPDWGGNLFNRIFNWKGEHFRSHEPPILYGDDFSEVIITEYKFNHYSYYFEKDVQFKDKWYGHHQGVHQNWIRLQQETRFPQPLTYLFPHWGTNSMIYKI